MAHTIALWDQIFKINAIAMRACLHASYGNSKIDVMMILQGYEVLIVMSLGLFIYFIAHLIKYDITAITSKYTKLGLTLPRKGNV